MKGLNSAMSISATDSTEQQAVPVGRRVIWLVLDSFGIGAAADAERFGDAGANTLLHIADYCRQQRHKPLQLTNLYRMGLGHACAASCGIWPFGADMTQPAAGAWGFAAERSSGKDTPSGHWEMAGVPVEFEWGYFPEKTNSFPGNFIRKLCKEEQLPGILGNCHASGTEILKLLGEQSIATGMPICYTSADSVLQIAAHEESFGLDRLLKVCQTALRLVAPYNIARVIARPFAGDDAGTFKRTANRHDYCVLPPAPTLLQRLTEAGREVISVGKIADIFAHQGVSSCRYGDGNNALFDQTLQGVAELSAGGLLMTNLVDFDMLYGHRRDTAGYAEALEAFDRRLPELLNVMQQGDLLLMTADHGCDPTWSGTDHTREHVPILIYGKGIKATPLGERSSFSDMGQTVAEYLQIEPLEHGESFLSALLV